MLWVRTAVFTILVPGTVLVLLPLALVASGLGPRLDLGPARYSGLVPLLARLAVILSCFADFVRRGRGTPAPYDRPRSWGRRRPLPLRPQPAVRGRGAGQGRRSAADRGGCPVRLPAALLAVAYHLFVRYYEEPTLSPAVRRGVCPVPGGGPPMAAEVARPNPALHLTAAASGGVGVPAPGAAAASELGVRLPNCPMLFISV